MHNAKFKLTKNQQTEPFLKLARSVALLHNPTEVASFLKDLLSEAEVLMLARRLQIAELLMDGATYDQIRSKLKVGPGTVARVQTWLELYGEGYRTVVSRLTKIEKISTEEKSSFTQLKRKYPMYFWPELLLKEIVKSANKREKESLEKIVSQMREKSPVAIELSKILNS